MWPVPFELFQTFTLAGLLLPKLPRVVLGVILWWYAEIPEKHILVLGERVGFCYALNLNCSIEKGQTPWRKLPLPRGIHKNSIRATIVGERLLVISGNVVVRVVSLWRPGAKDVELIQDTPIGNKVWLAGEGHCITYHLNGRFGAMQLVGREWQGYSEGAGQIAPECTPVTLADGRILLCGASTIFDPKTGTWVTTPRMWRDREGCAAVLLPNGRVLATGGKAQMTRSVREPTRTCEVYDPKTDKWTMDEVQMMVETRYNHALAVVDENTVLAIGGLTGVGEAKSMTTEILDLRTGVWREGASLPTPRTWGSSDRLTAVQCEFGRWKV